MRERRLWNLANAFLAPVRATNGHDIAWLSIQALDRYWGQLLGMYTDRGIVAQAVTTLDGSALEALAPHRVATLDDLVAKIVGAVRFVPDGEVTR